MYRRMWYDADLPEVYTTSSIFIDRCSILFGNYADLPV